MTCLGDGMKLRSTIFVLLVATLALPAAASASSTTLGSIVEPALPSAVQDCSNQVAIVGQATAAYEVRRGRRRVTSWSVNATGDGGGTETLYVLAPDGAGGYMVVGTDTETLPAAIPAGGTLTFTLATPILTASGDTFGLSAAGPVPSTARGIGGATPATRPRVCLSKEHVPGMGQTIVPEPVSPGYPLDLPNVLIDLAVTLTPASQDVAVSTTAGPSNATVNNEALLSSMVTNNGPDAGPVTFTDAVPAGLTIDAAAADGRRPAPPPARLVSCSFANLAVGASAPVEIVVTPLPPRATRTRSLVADAARRDRPEPGQQQRIRDARRGAPPSVASTSATRECVATNVKGLSEKVVKRLLPLVRLQARQDQEGQQQDRSPRAT